MTDRWWLTTLLLVAILVMVWWAQAGRCDGWVCFGPCMNDSMCGYGCVCVGASTGVGQCVSR